jgi:predicted  nucleic acid-binding Zn-ribbon protein
MARTDQPHKASFDDFVAAVTDMSNPRNEKHRNLDYGKPETRAAWNGSKSKIPIWCNTHEEFFTQQAANHKALGQGCPKCGKQSYKDKRKVQDPIADFRKAHGDRYGYSRVVYVNTHTPVEIICPEHGLFNQTPLNHKNGHGCQQCWAVRRATAGEKRSADYTASFVERAARVHDGKYAVVRKPTHSHGTAELFCTKHGAFTQTAHVHLLGHGCPACGKITSHAQRDVAAFVESLGVDVVHDDRAVLGGLHIDVWVPSAQVGIEYHGSFWHTQERVGNKHREKWERATAAGARLIQLFDFEWLERRAAVENRLRALFAREAPLAARKCELRPIPTTEARVFFSSTHTQGAPVRSSANYGLYSNGVLVAAMSFGKGRYSKNEWELLRYASIGRVQGGFSRLLSAFTREHAPRDIVSYCDLRWGDGRVYAANGFVLDGITPPDYWYCARDKRVSRYAAQRRPKGQSEKAWAEEKGYKKVLGVGHQRWVWRAA